MTSKRSFFRKTHPSPQRAKSIPNQNLPSDSYNMERILGTTK
uniref:Uncharacterized protein n=1 Tax=Arundo donax TaxID=35708 RepID=A0A0A9D7F9_ARUDO